MVLFRSEQLDVEVPENVTVWDWLFECPESSPLFKKSDKPLGAFIDAETRERLDWAEVKRQSAILSTSLIENYDLQSGDTVSIFCHNSIWYPIAMFATLRAGARINGASAAYTTEEMAYAIRCARTSLLMTIPSALDRVLAAAKLSGIPASRILLVQGSAPGFTSIQTLIQEARNIPVLSPYQIPSQFTNKDLCGYLNFSSGTTGLPKAVMISHHNVMAQCLQMLALQVDPDNVKILAVMPLFHITGTWRFLHYPILANGDAIMLPKFTMPAMLDAIVDFKIAELLSVPPILLRLARDPIVDDYDLRCLQRLTSGAAPIAAEVIASLQQRFPWTGFRQGYGATEAACSCANPPGYYDYRFGLSVGKLLPNTSAKVINSEGTELGPGEMGEVLVRGPQVVMGYMNNAKANAETFDAEGFYHTGDAGYFDEDGWLFVTDRMKEMIKVKGSQVPPAELEDLLLGHEHVADCAVISQPDAYAGELPKAYVVLKSHVLVNDVIGHELLAFVRQRKIRYKWLAEIEFIDKIPKSAAGKLLRRELRERDRRMSISGFRVRERERVRA